MSSIPVRMRKIQSKMKALEGPQHFAHYKTMRIFQEAQGQLPPESAVGSGRILNSSKIVWLSSLTNIMVIITLFLLFHLNTYTCMRH